MDPTVHRARTKALVAELRALLGVDAYRAFKEASVQYQSGALSDEAYFQLATSRLRDPRLLREMIALLPVPERRVALERCLLKGVAGAAAKGEGGRGRGDSETGKASAGAGGAGGGGGRSEATGLPQRERRGRTQAPEVRVLQPGLVLIKRALTMEQQKWLVNECFRVGEGTEQGGGFYTVEDGEAGAEKQAAKVLRLNMGSRGRLIDHVDNFPPQFSELCMQSLEAGRKADPALTDMSPNTVLINFYKENADFKWHKDSEDPQLVERKEGKTIVSFTVGLSAEFGFKHRFEDEHHGTVRLDSGDALLFGGPSRMIVHSVLRVLPKTMPPALRGHVRNGRLNVTYRDVGCGFVDPSAFPMYRVSYDTETR